MSEKFSDAEKTDLVSIFEQLGTKPKTSDPDALHEWMKAHLESVGKISKEVKEEDILGMNKEPIASSIVEGSTTNHTMSGTENKSIATSGKIVVGEDQLRFSAFSGDGNKGETEFDLWKYEVDCVILEKTHSQEAMKRAIRKSLKGTAGRAIMRLGAQASLDDIIKKLDKMFGLAARKQQVMKDFYNAEQKESEDVTTWGCRLEDIIQRAKQLGKVSDEDANEMLKERFWHGLRQDLQARTAHKYDSINDFDELRVAMRTVEEERKLKLNQSIKSSVSSATAKMSVNQPEYQDIKNMVSQLASTVDSLRKELTNQKKVSSNRYYNTGTYDRRRCFLCNEIGHLKNSCPRNKNQSKN